MKKMSSDLIFCLLNKLLMGSETIGADLAKIGGSSLLKATYTRVRLLLNRSRQKRSHIKALGPEMCPRNSLKNRADLTIFQTPCNISRTNFVSGTVGERSEPLRDIFSSVEKLHIIHQREALPVTSEV